MLVSMICQDRQHPRPQDRESLLVLPSNTLEQWRREIQRLGCDAKDWAVINGSASLECAITSGRTCFLVSHHRVGQWDKNRASKWVTLDDNVQRLMKLHCPELCVSAALFFKRIPDPPPKVSRNKRKYVLIAFEHGKKVIDPFIQFQGSSLAHFEFHRIIVDEAHTMRTSNGVTL